MKVRQTSHRTAIHGLLLGFFYCVFLGNIIFANGSSGFAPLKIGIGARPAGMGNAYTALATHALATFWNPAGLAFSNQSNAVMVHNAWLFQSRSDFFAFHWNRRRFPLAFYIHSFFIGEIPVRNYPSLQPLAQTSAEYLTGGFAIAHRLSGQFSFGATIKYLFEKIFIHTASGWAGDVGFRYRFTKKKIVLAAVVQNVGKMNALEKEATPLPVLARLGAGIESFQVASHFQMALAVDATYLFREQQLRWNAGSEIVAWQHLSFRTGFWLGYPNQFASFGVGVRKAWWSFDYSFRPFQQQLGNTHQFSLTIWL